MIKRKVDYERMELEADLHTSREWSEIYGIAVNTMMSLVARHKWNVKRIFKPEHLENCRNAIRSRSELKKDKQDFQWLMPDLEVYFSRKVKQTENEQPI